MLSASAMNISKKLSSRGINRLSKPGIFSRTPEEACFEGLTIAELADGNKK
jgi:hypothetical protein